MCCKVGAPPTFFCCRKVLSVTVESGGVRARKSLCRIANQGMSGERANHRELTMATETERLWKECEDYLAAEELELDDLEIVGSGRKVIRITIDAEDGLGVDRLARVSRALSRLLDESDPLEDSYTLEVSSPGLERKLRRARHYEKSLGSDVKVKSNVEIDGARSHRGVLESMDEKGFVMTVDGTSRRIDFEQVQSARTVFEWKRTPKPGQKSG